MRSVNFHLLVSSLLTYVLHLADGCSRTPARPKPTPRTPPPDKGHTSSPFFTTTTPSSRGQFDLPCDSVERKTAGCLHGGKCYVIELMEVRSAHCHCAHGWIGVRCQEMKGDFFGRVWADDNVKSAGIATGAVLVVIFITIIIVFLIVRRRKRRLKRQEERNQANGHACKSLIEEGTVVQYPSYFDFTPVEKSETHV